MAKVNFHTHNIHSETHVTERRAPTDESVRLLKEMESEAKQKIVDSITVNNTEFECNIQSEMDGLNDKTTYCVTYRMNGKKSRLYVDVPNWNRPTDIEVVVKVRDELAKDIAANMIDSVLRNAETRGVFIDKFK